MQSTINRLRVLSESVPVPLELPTEDQILEVEEAVLLPLPPSFRYFLMTVSDVVLGRYEPVTCADSVSHTYIADVTAEAWEQGVPREYWVLCQTENGYYLVDHESGEVPFWDFVEGIDDSSEPFDSVWAWADEVWLESV